MRGEKRKKNQLKKTVQTPSGGGGKYSNWYYSFRAVAIIVILYGIVALSVAYIGRGPQSGIFSLPAMYQRAAGLQSITNPVRRDSYCVPLSAYCRNIAEQLPLDARIFMLNMLGDENGRKLGYYYFMSYYLYPREVSISLDKRMSFLNAAYIGRNPTNMDELIHAGYNVAFNFSDNATNISVTPLAPMAYSAPPKDNSFKFSDALIAGILPLLAAAFGFWLLRFLFAFESNSMGFGEKFAIGLALGSLCITQFLFVCRLVGLRFEQIVFWLILTGIVFEVIRYFKSNKNPTGRRLYSFLHPALLLLLPHIALLGALLWLAGVAGLNEFDAVAGWALKAKILFLFSGQDIIHRFSEPGLAHAHFDYPILVPMLHEFTYGVLGDINEFVTKYWSVWMLVGSMMCVLSMCGFPKKNRVLGPLITLVILCMPVTMEFVEGEGGNYAFAAIF